MIDESGRISALEEHLRTFWNGCRLEAVTWSKGPVRERVPRFSTYRVVPQQAGKPWNYVTVGCSLADPPGKGLEFFLMSPHPAEIHAETLAMVAHFHSFEAHRLGLGSIVDLGRPWMRGSRMDHLLVSLPYPYGPGLEWSSAAAGEARFLWLLPIHRSEADLISRETLETFESMLDQKAVNILDADRDPIL